MSAIKQAVGGSWRSPITGGIVSFALVLAACTTTGGPTLLPIAAARVAIADPVPALEVCERARLRVRQPPAYPNADLDSIAWTQTSVEYRASATSVYRAAVSRLSRIFDARPHSPPLAAMEQPVAPAAGTPYAVLLDIDETVLDNSPNQALLLLERAEDDNDDVWDCWSSLEQATLVPGAMEMFAQLAQLRQRGINIRAEFITNRECNPRGEDRCPQRRETVNNINRLIADTGYQVSPGDVLMKSDPDPLTQTPRWAESEKHARRLELARHYHILMMLGDDLGDFYPEIRALPMAARCAATGAAEAQERWGDTWFMLPNAMYGSWMGAIKTAAGPIRRNEAIAGFDYPGQTLAPKRPACWKP
jgi:5'-nucleotidase (lipoprotein e(P4) family)